MTNSTVLNKLQIYNHIVVLQL